ncbi:MAG: ABC transporter substrate-binding protein [Bacteroidota bacterium]|jgi:NitT/TauT family transport system substrate-binding protein
MKAFRILAVAAAVALPVQSLPLRAEVSEINLAQQFGAIFIPLMAMENGKLIEKEAAARGMPDLKVNWTKMAGPSVMVDAIISGNLHFSAQGVPSMSLLWDRTKSSVGLKGISAITNTNIFLNTRNPAIKSIKDFTEKDRIALPSVKVSTQALFLQIAAEKEWGPGQHAKLDHLTVGLAHPDAIAAVLNPQGEITAHFATSPFHEAEMKAGLKTVTTGYDIMGGEVSNLVFVTTEKFRKENPKVYEAVVAAMNGAIDWTNADKRRAAKLYMEMTREKKLSEDDIVEIISAPGFDFTRVPKKTFDFASFMYRIGSLKNKPESWKDLYFAEAHGLPGS